MAPEALTKLIEREPAMEDVAALLSDGSPGPHRDAASRETGRLIFDALQSLSQRDKVHIIRW